MSERPSPRDRLIDMAAGLFYERGLPNVGINEVTDRAGVARMTLYIRNIRREPSQWRQAS